MGLEQSASGIPLTEGQQAPICMTTTADYAASSVSDTIFDGLSSVFRLLRALDHFADR